MDGIALILLIMSLITVIFLTIFIIWLWWNMKPNPICISPHGNTYSDSCPPVPTPGDNYQVEFVNQANELLLLGALGPTPVETNEGTWELQPNGGRLSINIPASWLSTAGNQTVNGPRFWVRTGCKYDKTTDKAQCETGSCGGAYDCSKYGLAGQAPASLAEFCFKCGGGMTYYDVSLVDGYNLSVNIEPLNGTSNNSNDPFWCKTDLCNRGTDLRSVCPHNFQLRRSAISSYIPGESDDVIACFSNCGKYEYPTAPNLNCDEKTDPKCAGWRKYCCQDPNYGKPCCNSPPNPNNCTDSNCTNGGACWTGNQRPAGPTNPATCQCRAYYRNASCPDTICTNPNGAPPPATCTDCIGDDTMHQVCPRAYTWPNDPQTYNCNATRYRITFAPGGTNVTVSPAGSIPKCSSLPQNTFDYSTASKNCAGVLAKYACAVPKNSINPNWGCNVDNPQAGCNGVICERDELPPNPSTIYPTCRDLDSQYDPLLGIQNCSTTNGMGSRYNCAVPITGSSNWACGIDPITYMCPGKICVV